MKKILTVALILIYFGFNQLNSQSNNLYNENQKDSLSESNYLISKKGKTQRTLESPKPLLRIREFNKQRGIDSNFNRNSRINALRDVELRFGNNSKNPDYLLAQQPEWTPVGPNNIGGRIRSIVHHPSKTGVVYVGAAAGGIWKTTNNGANWSPLFEFENAISFGALAIDKNNPDVMYAGTGEMIVGGGNPYLGAGLYKSFDAGNNWKLIGLADVGAFCRIFVHPKNSNLIIAGAASSNNGLFISTDAGQNWTKKYNGYVTDVSININNENEILIGVNGIGILYTSDQGNNWEKRNSGLSIGGRVSVQGAESDFNILYTLFERSNSRGAIYKSTDKGITWNLSHDGNFNFFRGQGFYNNFIQIHPSNPNIVLTGGIEIWRTSNGGTAWQSVSENTSDDDVHVDQHCAAFNPNNQSEVYLGNDGGMYRSTNAGNFWIKINNNLQVTQFYAMAVDYKQNNRNFGGTQDNGSVGGTSLNWSNVAGGDGFDIFVHPKDSRIIFGELYYGLPWKYLDNGVNSEFNYLDDNLPANDSGLWHSPFIIDEKTETMYLGMHAIYSSLNYGEVWLPLTQRYIDQFSAIAVSNVNSSIIYAGNESGGLIYSSNAGGSWQSIKSQDMPRKYITDIKTSYTSEGRAYVSFSGFGNPHLFKTEDFGKNWKDISVNLPDVPVNAIAIHPQDDNIIMAGTDVGVFASFDGGTSWLPYGRNLPNSPVTDLVFHKNYIKAPGMVLRAATHGRSIWETTVSTESISSAAITSPAGGETVYGTANLNLSWYGFVPPLRIEYSIDDGNSWNEIKSGITGNAMLWSVPDTNSLLSRIKVTSIQNNISQISRSFSIIRKEKGAPLSNGYVDFNTYGLTSFGDGRLWLTDYYSNKITVIDGDRYNVIKQITIPGKELFTDITSNKPEGILYTHRLNNTEGNGGVIVVTDTTGNLIDEIISPAKSYPIGLAFNGSNLFVSERDGNQQIYLINPDNPSNIISRFDNPRKVQYGPRCMTFAEGKIHQISTNYSSQVLNDAFAVIFEGKANAVITDEIPVTARSVINARGIEYDVRDGNYWVTDFSGNIYKIAGIKSPVSVKEDVTTESSMEIYPNPAIDFITINPGSKELKLFAESDVQVEIYNSFGELVFEDVAHLQDVAHLRRIDISQLPVGLYFVKIGNRVEKFVKM